MFAEFNLGWYVQVIISDSENKKFEMLNIYNTKTYFKKKVFINVYIDKAVNVNNLIDNSEWHYVKNQKDVEDLMAASWGFHDSYLADIKYLKKEFYNDPTKIQFLFTGCWECNILLEFERDVLMYFISDDENSGEILNSNIIFDNGFVYWGDECIKDISEITDEYTYIRGRSLKWKMITKID